MIKKVVIQMDPPQKLKPASDSTIALAIEAQKKNYQIYYYTPDQLYLQDGKVFAKITEISFDTNQDQFYKTGKTTTSNFTDIDVILMRQDPPFNMDYLTYTYLLEKLPSNVKVINNPLEVRNSPEKLLVCNFPDLMPPTLISADITIITDFINQHEDVVLKPLYGYGGNDIIKVNQSQSDLTKTIKEFIKKTENNIIAQKFMPEVKDGDKRIILINGKPVGAILRIPQKGSFVSNLAAGGTALKTTLTQNDLKICKTIAPELKKRNLMLVGIDVIGNYLTEINVTSPTGLVSIKQLDGINISAIFWDEVQKLF